MASDFYHEFARAYYGVSVELYQLASIATGGGAPEDYACASSTPQQYAGEDSTPEIDYELLRQHNELAPDLVRAAELLSKHGLHDAAAKAHSSLASFFSDLSANSNYAPASKLATYHESKRDYHRANLAPASGDATDDPDNWPVNPIDATAEQIKDDHEALRRSADEEGSGVGASFKAPKIDYAMTGTGEHIQPDEKNCSAAKYDLPSETTDISPGKAKKILRDGKVRGKELTPAQKGFFGAVAGTKK